MIIKKNILIEFSDLSFNKQEEIRNAIAESIKADREFMKPFYLEKSEEWLKADASFRAKVNVDDLVELEVEKLVMQNEVYFGGYIPLEMEII